jgi:hypothetical protein
VNIVYLFALPSHACFRPMAFLSELAANLSAHNIPMTIYSGNDDAISPHFGTECMSFCLSSC